MERAGRGAQTGISTRRPVLGTWLRILPISFAPPHTATGAHKCHGPPTSQALTACVAARHFGFPFREFRISFMCLLRSDYILPDAPMAGAGGGASGPTVADMVENFPARPFVERGAQNHCHLLGANVRGSFWTNCCHLYFAYGIASGRLICIVRSLQTVQYDESLSGGSQSRWHINLPTPTMTNLRVTTSRVPATQQYLSLPWNPRWPDLALLQFKRDIAP